MIACPCYNAHVPSEQTPVNHVPNACPTYSHHVAVLSKPSVVELPYWTCSGLAVVDEGDRVIGTLSERDLLRELLSHYLKRAGGAIASLPPSSPRRAVRAAMTRRVFCIVPEQPLAEVASFMLNKDVDRVPVGKEGKLVGFLTAVTSFANS